MSVQSKCEFCNETKDEVKMYQGTLKIKGKEITVESLRRICLHCNKLKFDLELDQKYAEKGIEKYNRTFGIRGEEITELRKSFGISQETLGKILGIAKKTIVSYEKEKAIPNDSYYTILKSLIDDRTKIIDYADINKSSLSDFEIKKIYDGNSELLIPSYDPFKFVIREEESQYNGYKAGSKDHILRIIQYIASKVNGKTKLAKTLFIADALSYSEKAVTLTGIQYAAINNGPIPDKFDSILDYMIYKEMLRFEIEEVYNHTQYNYFATQEVQLTDIDKKYLDLAIDFTKRRTASRLSDLTHELDIWAKTERGKIMSFDLLDEFSLDDWK